MAITLLAGVTAGCSADAIRLATSPTFTGSTPNQEQIINGQASTYGAPTYSAPTAPVHTGPIPSSSAQAVASRPLPPQQPVASTTGAGAVQAPSNYQPPAPYAAAGLAKPVGPINTAPVAYTPPGASAVMKPPVTQPAQQPVAQTATASGTGVYRVQPGDTLWGISAKHGVSPSQVKAANNMTGDTVKIGQDLRIPGGSAAPVVAASAAAPSQQSLQPRTLQQQAAQVAQPVAAPARVSPAPQVATKPVEAQPAILQQPAASSAPATNDAPGVGFRWPVQGKVISTFGQKANGERNDGINLAVPEGTSVKAAEDGVVIYAGNELKSYGNLVLIRHDNGWVSAYAHNRNITVKRGDQIRRGQIIAEAGMTGSVTTPQVHFELRKGATPVDPMPHLSDA